MLCRFTSPVNASLWMTFRFLLLVIDLHETHKNRSGECMPTQVKCEGLLLGLNKEHHECHKRWDRIKDWKAWSGRRGAEPGLKMFLRMRGEDRDRRTKCWLWGMI